mmetsp:Transcript_110782/g.312331  ORF Transcript_110782/g.312331 Transcript_110782/m.312331 type:complete len:248 (-) Transcript_110782:1293-2036(-)
MAWSKPFPLFLLLMFFLNRSRSSLKMSPRLASPARVPMLREASTTRESWRACFGVGSSSANHNNSNVPTTRFRNKLESIERRNKSRATSSTSWCSGWLRTKALSIFEACLRTRTDVSLMRPRTVLLNRRSMALAAAPLSLACAPSSGAGGMAQHSFSPSSSVVPRLTSRMRPKRSKVTCRTQADSSCNLMSIVSSTGLHDNTELSASITSLKPRIAVFRMLASGEFACKTKQSTTALRSPSSSMQRS